MVAVRSVATKAPEVADYAVEERVSRGGRGEDGTGWRVCLWCMQLPHQHSSSSSILEAYRYATVLVALAETEELNPGASKQLPQAPQSHILFTNPTGC